MHTTASRLAVFTAGLAALPVALGLAGCSSTANPPPTTGTSTTTSTTTTSSGTAAPTSSSNALPTSIEAGNEVVYANMGQTATISCESGKSLNVVGSNNTLTVTGTCDSVRVGGTGNKITIDKVTGRLGVAGVNNTITYKDGDPTVNNPIPGNDVKKGG